MIVILASAHDATAYKIVAEWAPWGAVLCTPADLSLPGWCHYVGAPGKAVAVVDGQRVPASAIAGVLVRLPSVRPEFLTHIATADRDYAASEMTAFLIAFLSALPGNVINRPSAGALCGPAWRQEQWIRVASRHGIPVYGRQRRIGLSTPADPLPEVTHEICVIGDRVFGTHDPALTSWAQVLANASGVGLLSLGFTHHRGGYGLVSVNTLPELDTSEKVDAVRELLLVNVPGTSQ